MLAERLRSDGNAFAAAVVDISCDFEGELTLRAAGTDATGDVSLGTDALAAGSSSMVVEAALGGRAILLPSATEVGRRMEVVLLALAALDGRGALRGIAEGGGIAFAAAPMPLLAEGANDGRRRPLGCDAELEDEDGVRIGVADPTTPGRAF